MQTFWEWLRQLRLAETYYGLDPAQYDQLFDDELEKILKRTHDPAHLQSLERLKNFNWLAYIAASVRHAGWHDQREVQERSHDIAVKLLTGKLFTGFDERVSGPFDLRFRTSVANAIRNMVELERNRRRFLPTVPIQQEFEPGGITAEDLPARSSAPDDDERLIKNFRQLVRRRLGGLGVAVLDARLAGKETKSLVGRPELGSPGKFVIKRIVWQVKQLAREFAVMRGDPELLQKIERAMASESETVAKRRAATAARQGVGV
jgi:hypothetical protein